MTRKEVLDAVLPLNKDQRAQWLITLHCEMTISAELIAVRAYLESEI